jgi:gamma-glutamylcyclotransferase (GGCT)/AIG2-like uncharacterized protein YtfP
VDLFVYGTLLFPEVLSALIGRVPPTTPAVAAGWRAAALPGRPYPGLVRVARSTTSGLLISGLDDAEWRVLDAYEDSEYLLTVITVDGGRRCAAYVWRHDVLDDDWDPTAFASDHLTDYVPRCRSWRARHVPQPFP